MTNSTVKLPNLSGLETQEDRTNGQDEPIKIKYNVVLGCPRSGTTFLMQCLNALSYSECMGGILLPVTIPHLVNQSLSPEVYQCLETSVELTFQRYLQSRWFNARLPVIAKWIKGHIGLPELIQGLQRQREIKSFIYKEPFLGFAPEFIYNALPNCSIIHIYRDGRDAADSLIRTYNILTDDSLTALNTAEMPLGRKYDHRYIPWWVEVGQEDNFLACTPYVRAIWMWKEIVRRCNDFFSRPEVVTSGRIYLLKYEDFVNEPLKYGKLAIEHLGGTMNPRLEKQLQQAKKSSIGIYQRRSPQEIEAAEKIAHAELKLYGYL